MKKILFMFISFIFVIISSLNFIYAKEEFWQDISANKDLFKIVSFLETKKAINKSKQFFPEEKISRAAFVKMTVAATFDKHWIKGKNCFSDVENEWFAKYVCTAKRAVIVSGYNDQSFRPEENINFMEAVKIISNTFEHQFGWKNIAYIDFINKENSPTNIADFHKEVTRQEAVTMLYSILKNLKFS